MMSSVIKDNELYWFEVYRQGELAEQNLGHLDVDLDLIKIRHGYDIKVFVDNVYLFTMIKGNIKIVDGALYIGLMGHIIKEYKLLSESLHELELTTEDGLLHIVNTKNRFYCVFDNVVKSNNDIASADLSSIKFGKVAGSAEPKKCMMEIENLKVRGDILHYLNTTNFMDLWPRTIYNLDFFGDTSKLDSNSLKNLVRNIQDKYIHNDVSKNQIDTLNDECNRLLDVLQPESGGYELDLYVKAWTLKIAILEAKKGF